MVLESTASGYVWQHHVNARDKTTILLQQNDLDVPLAPEETENHVPRFRIDDKVFKSLELGQDIVPDFDVKSMEYRHQIGAVIGLSFNNGGSRTLRTSHAFIINPRIVYDLDTQILLPLRPTEIMKDPEEYPN
ncbi:hypothetical protein POJ06DRAFT_291376 [Lipomyces tetrasporus]|uniref:Uncharacterized protein n=1 Tax=Lipomyces tetrasporus TaxID=54092 RepID=A0AAD7QPH8_9ASCO|nr:uncharacterized protein POJ06DRAFT_291376 [Lipomyces tetrasporus]KAJ8098999.1 hypothetical protein POJ06DRAFT_291376 [Lipomyces tetrasporus]